MQAEIEKKVTEQTKAMLNLSESELLMKMEEMLQCKRETSVNNNQQMSEVQLSIEGEA